MSSQLPPLRPSGGAPKDPLGASAADDFIFYLRRGKDALDAGQMDAARDALERAYELNPESAKVQNFLGMTYFKLGLLEAAKTVYDRLIAEHDAEGPLFVNLGLVLLRQGRLVEAEDALRRALDLSPGHVRAHCYLGLVQYRRGDLIRAKENFLKGGNSDFAEKVQRKLETGAAPGPGQEGLLAAVANDGIALLESSSSPLASVAPASDERSVRDEDAWETRVGHRRTADHLSLGMDDLARSAPTTLGIIPDGTPRSGSFPVQISERPSSDPAQGAARDELSGEPTRARTSDLEPPAKTEHVAVPTVKTPLRTLDHLPWEPGFDVGTKPSADARLVVGGSAYVRRTSIVATWGPVKMHAAESALGKTDDPFCRVEGRLRVLIKVRDIAVALRDVNDVTVPARVLAGFEGDFGWSCHKALGLSVVRLEGQGTVLLDAPAPAIIAKVDEQHPLALRRDAVLAWSNGLSMKVILLEGEDEATLTFDGQGFVALAGPAMIDMVE